MLEPAGNVSDAAQLVQVQILEEIPERGTCRSIRKKIRRSSQDSLRSRRRKAPREAHGPRCRPRCAIPAKRRGLRSCQVAAPMNCPGEDRGHRARQIQPTPESKMPGSESRLHCSYWESVSRNSVMLRSIQRLVLAHNSGSESVQSCHAFHDHPSVQSEPLASDGWCEESRPITSPVARHQGYVNSIPFLTPAWLLASG